MSSKPLSMKEFGALGAIAKARQENTRKLLAGTHLEWGKYAKEKMQPAS